MTTSGIMVGDCEESLINYECQSKYPVVSSTRIIIGVVDKVTVSEDEEYPPISIFDVA